MSTFDDIRLPEDVEQGATGGPRFKTTVTAMASGEEQRNQDWEDTRAYYDIGYGIQNKTDFDAVKGFFFARKGRQRSFRFKDWSDFQGTDEVLGTGDGVAKHFLLVKNYTSGLVTHARRITRPVAGTVTVEVDGTPTLFFTVGLVGGYVTFDAGHIPTAGQVVTASFEFDVPVRFDTDNFDLALTWEQAGEIASLPVIEIRDDINSAPTAVAFINTTTTLPENTSTASRVHVADVDVTDDPFGTNVLTLSGTDAASFELRDATHDSAGLYVRQGVTLDFETQAAYHVTVEIDDALVGDSPDATAAFTLTLTDVNEAPTITLTIIRGNVPDAFDTTAATNLATVVIHDDALGTNTLALTGTDAASFQLSGNTLQLKSGVTINEGVKDHYDVTVTVNDATIIAGPHPQDSKPFTLSVGVVPGSNDDDGDDTDQPFDYLVPEYTTIAFTLYGGGAGTSSYDAAGTDGGNSALPGLGLVAGGGKAPSLLQQIQIHFSSGFIANVNGGLGGTATGGDTNTPGSPGGTGIIAYGTGGLCHAGDGGDAPGGGVGGDGATVDMTGLVAVVTGLSVPLPAAVYHDGSNGAAPGGGGGGVASLFYTRTGPAGSTQVPNVVARGGGGSGGKVVKTFTRGNPGAPVPGDHVTGTIGHRGLGADTFGTAGNGAVGRITVTVA